MIDLVEQFGIAVLAVAGLAAVVAVGLLIYRLVANVVVVKRAASRALDASRAERALVAKLESSGYSAADARRAVAETRDDRAGDGGDR